MRQNYRGNKKRIEETKRKRKEEKKNRKLHKNEAPAVPGTEAGTAVSPEALS